MDTGLTLLAHSKVPLKFWSFAFENVISLINYRPSSALQNFSPFRKLFGKNPKYDELKIFGCCIFPLLGPYNKHKFDYRSKACVNLGLAKDHFGYNCLDLDTGRIHKARFMHFNEKKFPFLSSSTTTGTPQAEPSSLWLSIMCDNDAPLV